MQLAWVTDPHFNFTTPETARGLLAEITDSGAAGLLLSGDIAEAHDVCQWLWWLSDTLTVPIFFVLGNHDYYKGSIPAVRAAVAACSAEDEQLTWLSHSSPVWLTPTTALIGHGGWGDAHLGRWMLTPVRLNDHQLIAELSGLPRALLRQRLHDLGAEAARHLHTQLSEAVETAEQVIVLTHVPPFEGACWHDGAISSPDWLGDFTCASTGAVIARFASKNPGIRFQVFCGHTHGAGVYRHSNNLTVTTGAARYRQPAMQALIAV